MANELNRANVQQSLGPLFGNTQGLSYDLRTQAGKAAQQTYDTQSSNFYAPTEYDFVSFNQPQEWADDQSAAFGAKGSSVEIPTSSTNYSRPRTVAAAYKPGDEDPNNGTMTVVFRDGTFYNYYQVSPQEWMAFRSSYSKGNPWLNKGFVNGKQKVDGLFISKPRGPVSPDSIDPRIREQLYRVSRTQQIEHKPRKGKSTTTFNQAGITGTAAQYRESWTTVPNRTKADIHRKSAGLNKSQTRNGNRKAS